MVFMISGSFSLVYSCVIIVSGCVMLWWLVIMVRCIRLGGLLVNMKVVLLSVILLFCRVGNGCMLKLWVVIIVRFGLYLLGK